ncbi:10 kDa chaperonin 1, chloroplastic-like [Curcuma longa]|uniref:10 kDa chaperonin 1, chloroplastic-like n=1 Tax=Curcuma longa TaxID=136217 RepID=UPI003D9DFFDA
MASSLLAAAKPFLHPPYSRTSPPSLRVGGSSLHWSLPSSRRSGAALGIRAVKWEPSKVAPQADRVLIRLEELPEKSSGGVLLPKSAVKFERYLMGEILSVGSDVTEVEAGKKVLFSDINAYEVDLGTEAKHCFCKSGDLLAVVE